MVKLKNLFKEKQKQVMDKTVVIAMKTKTNNQMSDKKLRKNKIRRKKVRNKLYNQVFAFDFEI